jgi:hypothetical protein
MLKQFRLGISAVVALGAAGFATGAATAAPITGDLLARHADSSVVQVQYDPYYDPYSDPYWRAERWRDRSAWRAERWRERSAWREWRWRSEQARRAQWREERRRDWNGW